MSEEKERIGGGEGLFTPLKIMDYFPTSTGIFLKFKETFTHLTDFTLQNISTIQMLRLQQLFNNSHTKKYFHNS
jgi:hypothetical protein